MIAAYGDWSRSTQIRGFSPTWAKECGISNSKEIPSCDEGKSFDETRNCAANATVK